MSSSEEMMCQTDEMYEVEQIRDKRSVKGVVQYLVKWLHWDRPQDLTWQPKSNLLTVLDLVENFDKDCANKSIKQRNQKKRQGESLQILTTKKEINDEKHDIKKQSKNQTKSKENLQSQEVQEMKTDKEKSSSKIRRKQQKIHLKSENQVKKLRKKKIIKKNKKQKQDSDKDKDKESSSQQQLKEEKKENQKKQLSHSDSQVEQISLESSQELGSICKKKRNQLKIGMINKIVVSEQGQIYYEADMLNLKGQCVGVKYIESKEMKEKNPKQARRFLENFLIDQERAQNILNYEKS